MRQLIESKETNQIEFAKKHHITYDALKNYLGGRRKIPVEFLIKLSKEYNVTLDWFYGIDQEPNKKDSMVQIVNALSKVFTVAIRKTPFCDNDQVLLMDKRFRSLLSDIQSFCHFKEHSIQLDERLYIEQRRKIYEKHKKYLIELLGEVNFNENDAFEIYGVHSNSYNNPSDSILNYLASEE